VVFILLVCRYKNYLKTFSKTHPIKSPQWAFSRERVKTHYDEWLPEHTDKKRSTHFKNNKITPTKTTNI